MKTDNKAQKVIIGLWLGLGGLVSVNAQVVSLYTNVTDGGTLTLSQDVSVDSVLTNANAVGIVFEGKGTLQGPGGITVVNVATTNNPGSYDLTGIASLGGSITNQNLGAVTVINDQSVYNSNLPDTSVEATGIDATFIGDLDRAVSVTSTGGTSVRTSGEAEADAEAYGVFGVEGSINGAITVSATGGTASGDTADANASAYGNAYTSSNITSTVSATAVGGTATSTTGDAYADAQVEAVNEVGGNITGSIFATARGGVASSASSGAYAGADAYGVMGDFSGDFSGRIEVHAVGGVAEGMDPDAEAVAIGIQGESLVMSNFTGSIYVTATAGVEISGGSTNLSGALAGGIVATTNSLYLNASNGTISAQVLVPDGDFSEEDLPPGVLVPYDRPEGAMAAAIWGGDDADTVLLRQMNLVGDINLNGGINTLTILGDTHIDGDIYAEAGSLIFNVDSGILSFADTAYIRDLNGAMNVSSNAGLGLIVSAAQTNTPALSVEGALNVEEGATLAVAPKNGDASRIFGKTLEAISTTNLTGSFVESESSLFVMDITNIANSVWVIPTALKFQDTPVASATLASVGAVNTVMDNLSKQAKVTRAMARGQGGSAAPQGASGPSEVSGEWLLFVRQFNDLGGIDSDGAIAGYDWSTHGFLVGTEKLTSENMLLGVAAAGAWTDLDGESNSGGGNSDMLTFAAYGNYFTDNWYAELGLSYGIAWNESQRIDTLGDSYDGEYDSVLLGTWLEGGYVFSMNASFNLEPYGRLSYVHGEHDGYTESGMLAPMTVEDHSTDNLITELGLRVVKDLALENKGLIQFSLSAGWRQEWLDNVISVNTSVLGVDQKTHSPDADRSAFVLGMNGDWHITPACSLGVQYEPTFSGNWQNHAISGMATFRF